jgi:hypothetical protein
MVSIRGTLFRLVESQEQTGTLGYVDTLAEQALLEEMLEAAKPPYPDDWTDYHYLLKTPFRYPPLKWGSRFGHTHEPSLFYAGTHIDTALAESAFYRFVFWFSMDAPPIKNTMRSEHTLFSVGYQTPRGIQLQTAPFNQYAVELTHPQRYTVPQQLGSAMREAGVQAFEYQSARDPKKGICVALFSPSAFSQKRPKDTNQWLCEVSAETVSFKQAGARTIATYALHDFMCDGQMPLPA